MSVKVTLVFLLAVAMTAHGASVLDFLGLADGKKLATTEPSTQAKPSCLCKGPACVCCVDFNNMTALDLGGPGCVHIKHISPEQGFGINVSYGKKILQSSKVKGPNAAPICMNIVMFAKVCANVSLEDTIPLNRGCLELDLKIMGESMINFPFGCFNNTAEGMKMTPPQEEPEDAPEETSSTDETSSTEESTDFDAASFLQEVYQTAEQGVALLNSLLEFPTRNTTKPAQTTTTPIPNEAVVVQRRGSKSLKHPNGL